MSSLLASPLELPNGSQIKNRFAKSAMSEVLGTVDNRPTTELVNLYRRWAQGGSGLLITGNIMIDRLHLSEPGNVAIENERDLEKLSAWASAGQSDNTHTWVQLNHPGKQTVKTLTPEPIAPSAIPFRKDMQNFFATPRAMTEKEIEDVIQRFATAARVCEQAGFAGVQIHGAHGYLVSQFLSPHHNQRTDQWGGSLENRMRFVLRIYEAIREHTSQNFAVSIKMNSADFQRGGFSEEESMQVAKQLGSLGMDLIEVSGGNYESPQMTGKQVKESTQQREAYFLDYAQKVREHLPDTPLMVTGGFRSTQGMEAAVQSGATDLVGLGRPLSVYPDLPKDVLSNPDYRIDIPLRNTGIKLVDNMAMMEVMWYTRQIKRLANGKQPRPHEWPLWSFLAGMLDNGVNTFKIKRLRAN